MRRYGLVAFPLLALGIAASGFLVYSKELGMANTVRLACLFKASCDVAMTDLYKSVDWDTLCYATDRPLTAQKRTEYDCEFCRIVTLLQSGKPVYIEREEYVMDHRLAKSRIFLPEDRRHGSGGECFDRNSGKVTGIKANRFSVLSQDIYIYK